MGLFHGEWRRLMSNNWIDDKKWSDKFLPEIKKILGENLIKEAPLEEDKNHNTDLMVLTLGAIRVGCRVRKYEYFLKYPNDITIRSERTYGKTELAKIISGWGNYFFYGFSNENETNLISWKLLSLNEFRLWFNYEIIKTKKIPGNKQHNKDNSADFIAFDTTQMFNSIILNKFN